MSEPNVKKFFLKNRHHRLHSYAKYLQDKKGATIEAYIKEELLPCTFSPKVSTFKRSTKDQNRASLSPSRVNYYEQVQASHPDADRVTFPTISSETNLSKIALYSLWICKSLQGKTSTKIIQLQEGWRNQGIVSLHFPTQFEQKLWAFSPKRHPLLCRCPQRLQESCRKITKRRPTQTQQDLTKRDHPPWRKLRKK